MVFQLVLALILAGIGLLTALIALTGVLDPVATKMADDSDPFGDATISIPYTIFLFGLSLGFLVFSAYLLKGLDKKNELLDGKARTG